MATTALPAVVALSTYYSDPGPNVEGLIDSLCLALFGLSSASYVIGRIIIMVLAFISLRFDLIHI